MLQKITKRDQKFDNKIKRLLDDWFRYDPLLILKDASYGTAEHWKFIIYQVQRDAAQSLFFSYSNQHPGIGHKIVKRDDKVVYSAQVIAKAYYLRYCIILLQACGDKLTHLLTHALDIKKWRIEQRGRIQKFEVTEDNITLVNLKNHLKINENDPKSFFTVINRYLKNKSVKRIVFGLANQIKHKWTKSYQGEGLYPKKLQGKNIKNHSGRVIFKSFPIMAMTHGEDINIDIEHALITNNLFVDLANEVNGLLDFNKFYKIENGKKILDLSS